MYQRWTTLTPYIGQTHINSATPCQLKDKYTYSINQIPQRLHLPLQMSSFDLLYLGRNSWRGGRKLQGAARTACPVWRWHPGGTAAGWPAGPAQRSACLCAAWTGWSSRWQKTASWRWDGQRGERETGLNGHQDVCVCVDRIVTIRSHVFSCKIRIVLTNLPQLNHALFSLSAHILEYTENHPKSDSSTWLPNTQISSVSGVNVEQCLTHKTRFFDQCEKQASTIKNY